MTSLLIPLSRIRCRWGNLPIDDARQFGHEEVVTVLKDYQQVYSQRGVQHTEAGHSPIMDTIEVIV